MTALRYVTAGFYAGSLGYAVMADAWWVAFVVLCSALAWLPSTQPKVLVMRMEDEDA